MIARFSRSVGVVALAALLSLAVASSEAKAQYGYGLGFFNYGDGYGINYRQPPYYALFPPVYYSFPVARPYGFSPFAYPPGVMTPDVKPNAGAAMFNNPYVPSGMVDTDKTTSAGRIYYNPFVKQADLAGASPLAESR
jgi:hypothetical protein